MKRLQQFSAYLNQVFISALLIVVYLTAGLVTALMLHLSELLHRLATRKLNPTSTWRRLEVQKETDFTLPY